jgi:hypothetical protein
MAATLRELAAETNQLPALGDELSKELDTLQPSKPRGPARELLLFGLVSLMYVGTLLGALRFRKDLNALPRLWLIVYVTAWSLSFLALAYLVLVPPKGQVMPRWRAAGLLGVGSAVGFILAGLFVARDVPGVSSVYPATAGDLAAHGHYCLRWGITTALIPVGLGVLFLRGAVPVGDRWAAAALGAGGGCLGGLLLHLHCPIADYLHLGLIHGGVVVLSSLLTALVAPRLLSA